MGGNCLLATRRREMENCTGKIKTIPNTYIVNSKDKTYKSKGWFVGSGAIENGNKVVLQNRLKLLGMRRVSTAQYVLSLKAKLKSGL